ncbi:MAG TPA: CPBP family intramembrane metalloprotease [Saprospiraceae bacterium]|nr:CPBP family intramembrane metalloprotease [Saprospiraceae bacterium]HMQ83355.1 CPBP family intramembrane metalloprotease [Saprospiraceae bacterium]
MFFQSATKGDNRLIKYLLTLLLVVVGVFVGQIPMVIVIGAYMAKDGLSSTEMQEFQENFNFSVLGIDSSLALLLMILAFAGGLLMLALGLKWLHNKRLTDVLTGRPGLDWGRVFFAFGFWLLLSFLFEAVAYWYDPDNYIFQLEWKSFLPLLVVALFFLPLQTSFEEAIFRGYLMQGIGWWTKTRWIPLVLTSSAFGLLHFANPEVDQFGVGMMMTYYIGFGLIMGLCTLMDEGTELALGLHAATNFYGATFVTFSGSVLQTNTIFRIQELEVGLMALFSLLSGALFILVASYRYQWKDWGKLFRPIHFESNEEA